MLQTIRERAQGWIAWVIVILITIPFALWGIQEYLGVGGEPVAATVNKSKITERELDAAFQRFRLQLREQLGASYKAGVIDDNLLKGQVLNSLMRSELLVQSAQARNMQASDEMVQQAIASIPSFQKGGKFDYPSYEQGLRIQGLTPDIFFQRVRVNLVVDQLSSALKESEFATRHEVAEVTRLKDQKRELSYLLFPAQTYQTAEPVDEAAIQAYYEAHKESFMTPDRVKLAYIELSVEEMAKQVQADDKALIAYMESHADEFRLPEEFHARHILAMIKAGKEDEARDKAAKVLARLQAGEEFAQIAKAESDDPGSAKEGGDLGFFGLGVMDPAFEKAVVALKPGETSGLVRSQFGYHVVQLTEKRGGGKADFASVKDRVLAAYAKEEVQRDYYEKVERLTNLAYETPGSLEPIVKELNIPLKTSDWVTRKGGEGVLGSPKVVNAAFSEDVLTQGNNSDAIELGQEHILVLRVVNHEVPAPRPLAEVKAEIEQALKRQRALKIAAEKGRQALERLKGGESLDAVATKDGVKLEKRGLVGRFATDTPAPLLQEAFRLPKPQEGKPSLGSSALDNGDFAVVIVTAVRDGEPDPKIGADALKQGLAATTGDRYFNYYVDALKEKASIQITPVNPKPE